MTNGFLRPTIREMNEMSLRVAVKLLLPSHELMLE